MRFSTACIALLAAASALSVPVKKTESLDWDKFNTCMVNKEAKGCKKTLQRGEKILSKCSDSIVEICGSAFKSGESLNLEKECKLWEKSKCKTILEAPLSEASEACKAIPKDFLESKVNIFGMTIRSLLDISIAGMNFRCSVDENGELCPYIKYFNQEIDKDLADYTLEEFEKKEAEAERLAINAIAKACTSKACTEAFITTQEKLLEAIKEQEKLLENDSYFSKNVMEKRELVIDPSLPSEEKLNKLMEYLKSDECAAQHGSVADTKNKGKPSSADANTKSKTRKCIVKN